MIGLKLRNKFNKSHTSVNLQSCKKQWNKFSKVLRKAKQKYLNNLNFKSITGTNKFWKTVKPLFSNKSKTANTIILNKNNRIIKDNKNITYFEQILYIYDKNPQIKKDCSEKEIFR